MTVTLRPSLRRLAASALATAAAAALALGSGAAPAVAASEEVLVSTDGVRFSPTLERGLFEGLGPLIPGQSESSDLWIKNPTTAAAALRVSARGLTIPSPTYAEAVTLSTWDSGTGSTNAATLSDRTSCDVLVPAQTVPAGDTVKMVVTFTMADLDGRLAQGESANLDVLVAMRHDDVGSFPASACGDEGVLVSSDADPGGTGDTAGARRNTVSDLLASTGFELPGVLLATGSILVGAGAFLVADRRRQNPTSRG